MARTKEEINNEYAKLCLEYGDNEFKRYALNERQVEIETRIRQLQNEMKESVSNEKPAA